MGVRRVGSVKLINESLTKSGGGGRKRRKGGKDKKQGTEESLIKRPREGCAWENEQRGKEGNLRGERMCKSRD